MSSDFPFLPPQGWACVHAVSCARLYANESAEISRAESWQDAHPKVKVPDDQYVNWTSDCQKFRRQREYIESGISNLERKFPIAFSIVMYKDVEQTERLLRAIYRPHNYYCIHVDQKSTEAVRRGVQALAGCFDNVMVSSQSASVRWGTFSVLEADLFCMQDLLALGRKWRYFINLTGQEWPLKTNVELVKILKAINGSNLISGSQKGSVSQSAWNDIALYTEFIQLLISLLLL